MNTRELFETLGRILEHDRHNDSGRSTVGIRTMNGGIPSHYKSELHAVYNGFGWENGDLILVPSDPLVVAKKLASDLNELANGELSKRMTHHVACFPRAKPTDYLFGKKAECWVDGFEAGVRMMITSVAEDAKALDEGSRKSSPAAPRPGAAESPSRRE